MSQAANYFGSVTQSGTCKLGTDPESGSDYFVRLGQLLPLVHPDSLVFDGWDISRMNMGDSLTRWASLPGLFFFLDFLSVLPSTNTSTSSSLLSTLCCACFQ